MNRDVLTLLACSSSLAFIALMNSPANALMPPGSEGGVGSKVDSPTVNQALSQEGVSQPAQVTDARIRQLSQATFGCTCAVCMGKVRQMLQQGQLSI